MDEATRSAENIRSDIAGLKHRFTLVTTEDRCAICHKLALTRQIYVFPCQHVFHTDCIVEAMVRHLRPSKQRKLRELHAVIAKDYMAELDEIVAKECFLCGDTMINSIEIPFVGDDEKELAASWEL
ncbi:hypothetical protein THASP1DRAFT_28279 [Thamnocephalis sphaerospora]|uniref:RING-type domain-containing protein n=1 Tax=Thamnocephalis sphaerospora TaxID=78915 RepID=A0A4P9XUK9_9FUNG|nr:hypothetical protein THASP1DRAFT_28279 [Thamnocephalis sphaerospora]|eukprot:RKP09915.1 hypothetical protein THASP1DRAFT_28279 [Thamnocephalis sphaerospora]